LIVRLHVAKLTEAFVLIHDNLRLYADATPESHADEGPRKVEGPNKGNDGSLQQRVAPLRSLAKAKSENNLPSTPEGPQREAIHRNHKRLRQIQRLKVVSYGSRFGDRLWRLARMMSCLTPPLPPSFFLVWNTLSLLISSCRKLFLISLKPPLHSTKMLPPPLSLKKATSFATTHNKSRWSLLPTRH
jgi:hypothetical protein